MEKQKLDYFHKLLLDQRRQATEDLTEDRANAADETDGVLDSGDVARLDVDKSTALDLGERSRQLVTEIDEALLRIEAGTYGQCERCGKPIDEERLKAVPTARYDAECQAAIEAAEGTDDMPTL